MGDSEDRLQVMRDIVDMRLTADDDRQIGRVANVTVTWREDGTLSLHTLATGPEVLVGRIGQPVRCLAHLLLRGRFEHEIALSAAKDFDQPGLSGHRAHLLADMAGYRACASCIKL